MDGITSWWEFVSDRPDEIWERTLEHLQLVGWALFAATLIAVSSGVLVHRVRWLRGPWLSTSGVFLTIPSLALFAIFIPVVGLGFRPETLAFEVSVERMDRGVFQRLGQFLGLADRPQPLRLAWEEPGPAEPGPSFRSLSLDLPVLDVGDSDGVTNPDPALLMALAEQTGVSLANAQLIEHERETAHVLLRGLTPAALPEEVEGRAAAGATEAAHVLHESEQWRTGLARAVQRRLPLRVLLLASARSGFAGSWKEPGPQDNELHAKHALTS